MLYYSRIDVREGIDLSKSKNKNAWFSIGFLIMDSNFKILHAIVVMIWLSDLVDLVDIIIGS